MGGTGGLVVLKTMGIAAFVVTTLLLAVSFFVLSAARKSEEQGMKVFGYVVTILLWVCAAIVFSGVISAMTIQHNLKPYIGMRGQRAAGQQMMQRKQQMMQEKMPMMQQEQGAQEGTLMPMPAQEK